MWRRARSRHIRCESWELAALRWFPACSPRSERGVVCAPGTRARSCAPAFCGCATGVWPCAHPCALCRLWLRRFDGLCVGQSVAWHDGLGEYHCPTSPRAVGRVREVAVPPGLCRTAACDQRVGMPATGQGGCFRRRSAGWSGEGRGYIADQSRPLARRADPFRDARRDAARGDARPARGGAVRSRTRSAYGRDDELHRPYVDRQTPFVRTPLGRRIRPRGTIRPVRPHCPVRPGGAEIPALEVGLMSLFE